MQHSLKADCDAIANGLGERVVYGDIADVARVGFIECSSGQTKVETAVGAHRRRTLHVDLVAQGNVGACKCLVG